MEHNKNKKNILYLSPTQSYYGAERCLFELAKYLNKDKFTPYVIAQKGATYKDKFSESGIPFFQVDLIIAPKMKNLLRIIKLNYSLTVFVIRHKINLVHINFQLRTEESLIPFFIFMKLSNIPWVYHLRFHETFGALKRFILFRGYIISVSEQIRKQFLSTSSRFSFLSFRRPDRALTVHDGKDLSLFLENNSTENLREQFKLNGKCVIGIVGAIDPRKRQDLFLLIANEIKKTFPMTKFLIIGDTYSDSAKNSTYKQNILKMVENLGLKEDVVFTGYRNDVHLFLKLLDVCVLTSERDPFPGTIIEAMASEKPIVAAAVDGVVEMVDDEKTGFLIRSNNPKEYANRISLLLTDEHIKNTMGIEARKKAIELFSIQHHVLAIEEAYEKILN